MSRSYNVSFTQSFKVVVADAFLSELRQILAATIKMVESIPEAKRNKDHKAALKRAPAFLAADDETLAQMFLKQAMRDGWRDEMIKVLTDDQVEDTLTFSKFAPSFVTVTPRES